MTNRRRFSFAPSTLGSLAVHVAIGALVFASAPFAERAPRAELLAIELVEAVPGLPASSNGIRESSLVAPSSPPPAPSLARDITRRAATPRATEPVRQGTPRTKDQSPASRADVVPNQNPPAFSASTVAVGDALKPAISAAVSPSRAGAAPYAEHDVDQRPRLIGQPSPRYPSHALRLGIEADVVLSLVVSSEGQVREARVRRGVGRGFDEAALGAARGLRFLPGRRQGVSVSVAVTWTCRFRLDG